MTLSLQHSAAPWDRTLPKPSTLHSHAVAEAYPRRSTSLLQHHIAGNQLLSVNGSYAEKNGRRSTVACIPAIHIPEHAVTHAGGGVAVTHPDACEHLTRKRPSSVMSAEGTSRSSSPTSTSPLEGSNQFCLCQKEPKIPRPRNAFILYRQHHHAGAVAQNPGLANPDISKIIGEQWRQLPDKVKEEWKALAEDEKARHSQQYPDYRYKPKRNNKIGGQSSVSGPSTAASDTPGVCQKCGGKPMNTPSTPYTPVTPGPPTMPQMVGLQFHQSRMSILTEQQNPRMSTAQQVVSPPHSGRMHHYSDPYGRPIPPPHDPRFQYAPVQHRPGQVMEGPEPKKRRFNGDAVYATARPMYSDHTYQHSPHDRTMSDAMAAGQLYRPNMGPPARTGYPVQVQQPSRPTHPQQHRRDPTLTLPPLKTPLSQQVSSAFSVGPQSQKSGIEAMIMSIPVLNKVKILSQIAPYLAAPGPASPPRETRGAIIAVEGMDATSVYSMTNSLAEQLEKEGKFAVRIFGGPDPYALLASSNRASGGEAEHLSVSNFLDLISHWHKISKEMQEYITRKPRLGGETPDDVIMQEVEQRPACPQFVSNLDNNNSDLVPRAKSPVSAVSPKTITTQTADLSLKSPPSTITITVNGQQSEKDSPPQTPQTKSRIPASALAQSQPQAQAEAEPLNHDRSGSTTPRQSMSQTHNQAARQPTSIQPTQAEHVIPIAIVPHYQLTTVDASSIALPITDSYSPHSHWQWLATLWRGCVGPDATVIIQAGDMAEDGDGSAGPGPGRVASQAFIAPPSSHQPGQAAFSAAQRQAQAQQQQQQQPQSQQQQDVEVRLLDCRSVVVRAPGSAKGRSEWEGSEWWEKAKRRVGFEVEEFLRK